MQINGKGECAEINNALKIRIKLKWNNDTNAMECKKY